MHAARHRRHLISVLAEYLGLKGVTVAYAPLDSDAYWAADEATLILRDDAPDRTHLEILRDLIDITDYGHPSQLGAAPRRHLFAVPA